MRFNLSRKFRKNISLHRLVIPIAVIAVMTSIASFASFYKIHVGFFAINGAYQTFNPIRRLFEGQTPALDFNSYLGIGTTYLIAGLAALTGYNFAAVNFSNHFLHLFCHFLAFWVLLYLIGLSIRRSLLIAAIIISIITWVQGSITMLGNAQIRIFLEGFNTPLTTAYPLIQAWSELTDPGLSNLGLRSALPFLTSLAILIGFHTLKQQPFGLAIFCGSLIGLQPLWSNDYGFISTLVLLFISILYISKQTTVRRVPAILSLSISSLLSFGVAITVITQGHAGLWFRDNVLGVASDQFWYFGFAPSKIFSLDQLFPEPFLFWYAGILLSLCLYLCFTPVNLRQTLLLYIALTTFGAGLVCSIGGGSSSRYFVPAFFVSYFVLFWAGLQLLKILLGKIPHSSHHWPQIFANIRDRSPDRPFRIIATFSLISIYTASIVIALDHLPGAPRAPNYFYVKTLGGWLPNSFSRAIEIAENIADQTQDLPPERRILSTYASMIDTLAGSRNATGIDYIIHALGEDARQKYRDRYQMAQPKFITTIRTDYSTWENWVRRVNWWFYREFLPQYELVDATFYNLIWQRREQPQMVPQIPVQCTIKPQKPNSVNLTFTSQSTPDSNQTYYLDVSLAYALSVQKNGIPRIGDRGLINATEIKVPPTQPGSAAGLATYGLPPHHDHWTIPVIHRLGEPSIINLTGFPEDRTTLKVDECTARILTPADRFAMTQTISAKAVSDDQWQNGIAIGTQGRTDIPSKAGYLSPDPMPYGLLIPGMMIEFPQGGVRKVVEIRGNQVWVDGDALAPQRDGYPNPIRLLIR
jgi:hypothetical protein